MDDNELRRRPDARRRRVALSRRHFRRQARASARHGLLFVASLLGPLSPNLNAFLTAQFLAGVGTGTFIPLTIGFIVRSLPQRLVLYGLAVYAMNSELSQNVAASLEGWYSDNLSVAVDRMAILRRAAGDVRLHLVRSAAREDQHSATARPRLARACLFRARFSLCSTPASTRATASTGSTTVSSMGSCSRAALLTLAFVVRELIATRPFLNLRLLARKESCRSCCSSPASASSSCRRPISFRPISRSSRTTASCRSARFCSGLRCRSS